MQAVAAQAVSCARLKMERQVVEEICQRVFRHRLYMQGLLEIQGGYNYWRVGWECPVHWLMVPS